MTRGTFKTLTIGALMVAGLGFTLLGLDTIGFFERYQAAEKPEAPLPEPGRSKSSRPVVIDRAADGHFWVVAYVNDERIRFLLDTGASLVVLSRRDAERLGYDPWEDEFTMTLQTVSGPLRVAPVTISEIEVGDRIVVYQVPGAVIGEGIEVSLLGQGFLRKLSGYEVDGDQLILRQ